MNTLAEELNKKIEGTTLYSCLSDFGLSLYMPNGITVQSQNAKAGAKLYNATIGTALQDNKAPQNLKCIRDLFAPTLSDAEVFGYAPTSGFPKLRQLWKEDMLYKNPSLKNAEFSLPIVTQGLTNALFMVCKLFVGEGDAVVLPNLYWENYELIIENECGGKMTFFNLFKSNGFDLENFDNTIAKVKQDKVVILLNFPNNPTGYTPTKDEAKEIKKILLKHSKTKKLVVIVDDAYFSLFFEKDCLQQSIFSQIANASENIIAVKCDAATKEEEVWGFRVGFLTFATKNPSEEFYYVLEKKIQGIIRGTLSCCSTVAQSALIHAFEDDPSAFKKQRKESIAVIQERYDALKEALAKHKKSFSLLKPLPFNSGYFMSFKLKENNAIAFQKELLDKDGIGVIALFDNYIRIAFASVSKGNIEDLIDKIYERAESFLK